tara:strand:- start:258 stop:707 length:450 start_codon:yes stop_codon:yes gene_type:complete
VTSIVNADETLLSNGDKISGIVIKIEKNILVINSPIVGKLEIPMSNVVSFSTQHAVSVVFKNNDQLTGLVSMNADGLLEINSSNLGRITNIATSEILSVHQAGAKGNTTTSSPAVNISQAKTIIDDAKSIDTDEVLLKSGDRLLGEEKI